MLDLGVLSVVETIQKANPEFLLCGSAALILLDMMPNRSMSDIDFVTNKKFLKKSSLCLRSDKYNNMNDGDKYESYSCSLINSGTYKINVLAFDDDVQLYYDSLKILHLTEIKHQRLQDIINWKEKYNRPKDIQDLEKILTKVIETTVLEEKI